MLTGNPVRDAVIAVAGRAYEAPAGEGPIHLLVFGGSQGAKVMSDVVPGALARLPDALRRRLAVVQQARAEDMDRAAAIYEAAGVDAELSPFFDDMPERIATAHLVIGRSGASTISELAVVGRPSILVPLPHSLDNDQKANAEKLASAGAAWAVEQKNFTEEALANMLTSLLAAPAQLTAAARAARAQGQPDAVRALADLVERLGRGELETRRADGHVSGAGGSGALKFAIGGA